MVRKFVLSLLVILGGGLLGGTPAIAENADFTRLCREVLVDLQKFDPVHATQMGVHEYDYLLADYSSGSVRDMIGTLRNYHKKLRRFQRADLTPHERINYRLIESNINMKLHDLDRIRWHRKSPQLYVDQAIEGVHSLMTSRHAPLAARMFQILERMKRVPKLMETAEKNIKKAPPVYIEIAQQSLADGIDFYKTVAGELMRQFPEEADDILKYSTAAREAMNDFSIYLSEVERDDPRAFAVGEQDFNYILSHSHLLEIDADSLLRLGERLLADVQAEYTDYLAYVENQHQEGADSVFVPASFTRQDVLDYYDWEVNQVKTWLEQNDIITVPEDIAPIEVVQTPAYLRALVSGIAYEPAGPFSEEQVGFFYVRPIPEDLDRRQIEARYRYVHRRGFRSSVVHEAYPGHHLQLQLAGRTDDPVRTWQQNILLIEGWALYSEEMMYHAGLYGDEDPAMWLAILRGIRFRAARIIADVKLHTGEFTYEECVDWMVEALGVETEAQTEFIRAEVRRYTLTPTVQMSYLLGKVMIQKLRDDYRRQAGSDFSERSFHDALLGEGAIPPVLVREAMGL